VLERRKSLLWGGRLVVGALAARGGVGGGAGEGEGERGVVVVEAGQGRGRRGVGRARRHLDRYHQLA
jgi:hypothetical protein